ncbi:M20/M25/M40 family metallo-hydrolase [Echinimonas agarilytica]|uniref:Carboxypeptidase Q n=1 Tax=Echinimonas agarilytica TaxID=1215918 RepID=A0AA41W8N8_9GAMM|nr:M20/M25/M40 family metallo-hydrolase [Echinimonas agarilytica]MCM2680598.1 M20/M25/M40 family metallo-hydrolase [Echinimonas agarilytica]
MITVSVINAPLKEVYVLRHIILSFAFVASIVNANDTVEKKTINEQLIETALTSRHALDILTDLTTNIGPRLPGTEADLRTVAWAENLLTSQGFDRVYKQPVRVPAWKRGIANASIVSPAPQALIISALGHSVGTPEGGITAPVVRVSSLAALSEISARAVKGHIVFIDHKMERHRAGKYYREVVGGRSNGASIAATKGAVGLLIRSIGTDSDRFAHTGMMLYDVKKPRIPSAALSAPDADQLTRLLTQHGKVTLNFELGSEHLESAISYNVIAEYDGAKFPEQYVLVGAHHDSWDEGTGALDDGAGIAIVTAAAKQIIDLPDRPKRGVRVVLYAAEELGLVGAKAYARENADDLHNIYLASESDFGAGEIWKLDTRFSDALSALSKKLLKELAPLNIEAGHNKATGGPDTSVLVNKGVPALTLLQDGTDYFDFHHTPNDTLDKVSPEALKQNVAAWSVMLWTTTNSDAELRPISLKKTQRVEAKELSTPQQ